jgi:hypothetical protein
MVPMQMFCTSVAAIGISSIYAVWSRYHLERRVEDDRTMRERVTFMLWVAATRG